MGGLMIKNTSLAMGLAAVLTLLAGCGSGEENPAPDGSTITINPASTKWTTVKDDACAIGYASVDDLYIITVEDSAGNPLNNVKLTLFLDLAAGSTSITPVMELYDNGSLVTSPYTTKTEASGTKAVTVRMWYGCSLAYKGSLHAYSGSIYGSAPLEVEAIDAP
ncbi:MAG: hypothetical protein A2151_01595 [Candidatus Muproteobacteria bacterium RBG_16_65_34]|uniref:Lipoprotein n=1 Tax=Candidatus Muproteobacteria bacterium RBG_16_65_34 TaxID=1817760 RepID=A0A1F6TU07_9PROT|nr:MAG: hypothetical protein A2151_01595 [Candidatus Muproteobacteria bacterium RBG_16_65_34]